MFNTNSWNKIRYTLYQPIYDLIVAGYFRSLRKQSIEQLSLNSNAKVLILGAGTGLDLEFLHPDMEIHAIDVTPAMISKFKNRASRLHLNVSAMTGDAQHLTYSDDVFDAVILHLIVAVIPDAEACLKETERVLKPGGSYTIMDKFVSPGKNPSLIRKIINPFSVCIATNLNRDVDTLLATTNLIKKVHVKLGTIFWLIQGNKPG